MLWDNLKLVPPMCPICSEPLEWNERSKRFICSDFMVCDFTIGLDRFNEIAEEEDAQEFSGSCEVCGRKINPRYRTCKDCI